MQLLAVALCLIMIATVGAGVVAAKGEQSPPDKEKQFDVLSNGEAKGTIIITKTWKYVVNARGLAPDMKYWLKCDGVPGVLATATADAKGGLHVQGEFNQAPSRLIATGATYFLGTGTPPPEAAPYIYCDAKYCACSLRKYEVYGTVVLCTPNADGGVTKTPLKDAQVLVSYPTGDCDGCGFLWGMGNTNDKGNFYVTGLKGAAKGPFYVQYYSADEVYFGTDYNVEKTTGCPVQT